MKENEETNHRGHGGKDKFSLCSPEKYPHKDITEKIISSCIEVHTHLGAGLLESIYEKALGYEFRLRKIKYEGQKEINLEYKGVGVGKYRIDFLVEDEVILEIKAVESLDKIFSAQLLTYLKAMDKKVGLLINFNVLRLKEGIKRLIL